VLELGAGVGLPGLLLTVLKRNHLDRLEMNLTSTISSTSYSHDMAEVVGPVCLTDYESDVLDNLVRNVHQQFRPTCDICHHPASDFSTPRDGSDKKVYVTVKQLDWTDEVYTLTDKKGGDKEEEGGLFTTTNMDVETELLPCAGEKTCTISQKEKAAEVYDLLIGSELIYMSSLVSLANVIL
jgi:hypothetical protein